MADSENKLWITSTNPKLFFFRAFFSVSLTAPVKMFRKAIVTRSENIWLKSVLIYLVRTSVMQSAHEEAAGSFFRLTKVAKKY